MPHRNKPERETVADEHLMRQLASLDPPHPEPHWGQFRSRVLARLESPRTAQRQRRRAWWPLLRVAEVMSVVIVLGLAAAVVMPRLVGQTDTARYEQARIQIRILEDALKRYKIENGRFPTTAQGLQALVEKPSLPPIPQNWPTGGYLDKPEVPRDPWGNTFIYISPGQHHPDYDIVSLGADGLEGGSGYDADVESWRL